MFFPTRQYALLGLKHEHRPIHIISKRTWCNTSGRTQKAPAAGMFQSKTVFLKSKRYPQNCSHRFEEHIFFSKQHNIYWEIRWIFEEHATHVAQILMLLESVCNHFLIVIVHAWNIKHVKRLLV